MWTRPVTSEWTCVTHPCANLDTVTLTAMAAAATGSGTGSGVLGFTVDGEPYVGLVQQVNGVTCTSDAVCTSHSYYVLSKYRQQLPTQLPCDRTVGGSCAEFNAVALTGYMMSAVLVSEHSRVGGSLAGVFAGVAGFESDF